MNYVDKNRERRKYHFSNVERKARDSSQPSYWACERKRTSYVSERSALMAVEEQAAYTDKPLRTYRCQFCKGWHLTSQVQVSANRHCPVNTQHTARPIF